MNNFKIYTRDNIRELQTIPILSDEQIYIYVILNSHNDIKIGKTTNIVQRITSLSGSNGGGSHIKSIWVSPATYLYSIEITAHTHFNYCRIPNTEWFNGTKVNFDEAIEYVYSLFISNGYERCNEERKKYILSKKILGENK